MRISSLCNNHNRHSCSIFCSLIHFAARTQTEKISISYLSLSFSCSFTLHIIIVLKMALLLYIFHQTWAWIWNPHRRRRSWCEQEKWKKEICLVFSFALTAKTYLLTYIYSSSAKKGRGRRGDEKFKASPHLNSHAMTINMKINLQSRREEWQKMEIRAIFQIPEEN